MICECERKSLELQNNLGLTQKGAKYKEACNPMSLLRINVMEDVISIASSWEIMDYMKVKNILIVNRISCAAGLTYIPQLSLISIIFDAKTSAFNNFMS